MEDDEQAKILEQLKGEGFEEEIVIRALNKSIYKTMDDVLFHIIEMKSKEKTLQESKLAAEKRKEEMKILDNEKRIEEAYKQTLIERYKKERDLKAKQSAESVIIGVEKSAPYEQQTLGPDDINIKVRISETGHVMKFVVNKQETLSTLMNKLRGYYGNKNFSIFDYNEKEYHDETKTFTDLGIVYSQMLISRKI